MSLIYTPKRYDPRELISPAIYELCGADALYMYDPAILRGLDKLSEDFGPMIGNTWWSPRLIEKYGFHRFRGLRAKTQKIGASKSSHKIGIKKFDKYLMDGYVPYSGADVWPVNISAVEVREHIRKVQGYWIQYFTRMETHKRNGQPINWIHVDSKPHKYGGIRFFKQ